MFVCSCVACRVQQSIPSWCLSCMMRLSGRGRAAFTHLTFWTKMGSLWSEMPSCPFLQVGERSRGLFVVRLNVDDTILFLHLLSQVAGFVWESLWPRWSSSFSSPPSCNTFVSLLHLEFRRMTWIWLHALASPSTPPLINCVPFPVCEQLKLKWRSAHHHHVIHFEESRFWFVIIFTLYLYSSTIGQLCFSIYTFTCTQEPIIMVLGVTRLLKHSYQMHKPICFIK